MTYLSGLQSNQSLVQRLRFLTLGRDSMSQRFRILSLSGGGVRGIFQATYLLSLQRELGLNTIKEGFDLIAGTSTGAIIALSIACGVSLQEVAKFYKERAALIFKPRIMSGIRRGPKYSQTPLREALSEVLKAKQLKDADKLVLVPAATLDRFQHRVFSNIKHFGSDETMLAVEVALASAAAPTYFAPVQPNSRERTYVDGGVWANSPSLLAILVAHRHLNIPLDDISVLSVGTGYFPNGRIPDYMRTLRPYSLGSVRTVLELFWDSQSSFADEYSATLVAPGHFTKVDVSLDKNMPLDDVEAALTALPPLAEKEAVATAHHIKHAFFTPSNSQSASRRHIPPPSLIGHQIPAAGLTAFYPTRDYYRMFRAAATVDAYVGTAKKSVVMISINLMTGVPFDGLCDVLKKRLEGDQGFSALISLIDPKQNYLMDSLAPVLNMTSDALASSIADSLSRLTALKQELSESARRRFSIRVHRSIPLGSAILLDHKENYGRIQIETKIYKAPFRKSFAFEVIPTDEEGFYATLAKGYEDLLKDGELIF